MTPKLTFRHDAQQNDCIFWENPWTGEEEAIAIFRWPTHPPEKTEEVEKLWETMGKAFANSLQSMPTAPEEALIRDVVRQLIDSNAEELADKLQTLFNSRKSPVLAHDERSRPDQPMGEVGSIPNGTPSPPPPRRQRGNDL